MMIYQVIIVATKVLATYCKICYVVLLLPGYRGVNVALLEGFDFLSRVSHRLCTCIYELSSIQASLSTSPYFLY